MKEYTVTFRILHEGQIIVEAENEDAAAAKVEATQATWLFNNGDINDTEVEVRTSNLRED